MDMDLHGPQQAQLQRALLDAFRRPAELAEVVTNGLDQNLYEITEDGTLESRVFSLIEWAESHGRLADLVRCAHAQNPGNPLLRAFVAQYLGAAALESAPTVALPDLARVVVTPSPPTPSGSRPADPPLRVAPTVVATGALNNRSLLAVLGALVALLIVGLGGGAVWNALLNRPPPTPTLVPTVAPTLVPLVAVTVAAAGAPTLVPLVAVTVAAAVPPATGPQGRIAFTSRRGDGFNDIYVVNPAAPTPVRLTDDPADDHSPAWAPDGSRIAFDSDRDGSHGIYVMAADGGSPRPIATFTSDPPPFRLGWSPDGQRLVFERPATNSSDLFIVDSRGGVPLMVTIAAPDRKIDPAWSPDATQLAFTLKVAGQDDICVVNTRGGALTNLTHNPSADEFLPAWSPDGRRIAYTYRSGAHDAGKSEIYVMNADGSEAINLTDNPADDNSPTWSPDGRWIAFASNRANGNSSDNHDIYILDTQNLTRPPIRITDRSWNAHPAWRPGP